MISYDGRFLFLQKDFHKRTPPKVVVKFIRHDHQLTIPEENRIRSESILFKFNFVEQVIIMLFLMALATRMVI